MNTTFKYILGATAFALVTLASCQKNNNQQLAPAADQAGNYKTLSLVTTCPITCTDRTDTLKSNWVDASLAGSPTAFTPMYYSFDAGQVTSSANYHFYLSGQFLSRLTAGATLGYFDSTAVPPSSFSSIDCGDTTSFTTSGVVSNAMGNHTASAHGWYIYNYMNPFLVTPSWVMGIYFPSCGKYYAVKLTVIVQSRINSLGDTEYQSNVIVQTKCLGCGS